MNRIVQARALLSKLIRVARKEPISGAALENTLDEALALLDLENEEREAVLAKIERGEHFENASRPEWRDGWPRGTWLDAFGVVFEVGSTVRDVEGALMYLVPARLFGVDAGVARYVALYAGGVNQARLSDGRVYTRII